MAGNKSGIERLISRSNPGPVTPESLLLRRGGLEPWMVDELRDAERNIRHWRLEVERRLAGGNCKRCASCGEAMPGRADRRTARIGVARPPTGVAAADERGCTTTSKASFTNT